MKSETSLSKLPSDFDAFLFSPVSEDTMGHPLNVLSVLARSDYDPWQEAAKLALMPRNLATLKLAPLIATYSARRTADPGAEVISARLVALLPSRAVFKSPAPRIMGDARSMTWTDAVICIVAGVFILGIALGSQLMSHDRTGGMPAAPFKSSSSETPTSSTPGQTGSASSTPGQ
jgi:hypothetical protein